MALPELSRFELQCLRLLWSRGRATVREIHAAMDSPPSYSTVRKIFERLEQKGAVTRDGMEGKACAYRSAVSPSSMIRKEIRGFLDGLFDGRAAPLIAHLAEMRELSLDDLRRIESLLEDRPDRPAGGSR